MNLYLRVLIVLIGSFFKKRIENILSPSLLTFYVLPNDLDFNGHMNNGRYFTIMDLGRFDLILRTGLLKMMLRHKSVPILASSKIRYRLPLMPFQKYILETRILCWDPRWVYLEQRFLIAKGPKSGAVAAIAIVKGGFFDKGKKALVPSHDVLSQIQWTDSSPDMPYHIRKWQDAEEALRKLTQEN